MNKIAKESDLSLYGFVNEVFELILRANELGVNLSALIDSRELLKSAMDRGFTLGLERLWYEMAELAYGKAKNESLKSWFDTGVWFAKRYVTGEADDSFEAFKNDLKDFTWNVPPSGTRLMAKRFLEELSAWKLLGINIRWLY